MSTVVYAGAKAPEAIAVTITRGKSNLDMTTVTSVTLVARAPDNTEQSWSTVVSGKTTTQLVATHIFDSGGLEVENPITLRIMPHLAVPGGTRRGEPFTLQVIE